jgi:UTP--glucose-1-phosphate uridylyltransferase
LALVTDKHGLQEAVELMQRDGQPGPVIKNFERLFECVLRGETGIIQEEEIEPVLEVDSLESLHASGEAAREGRKLLNNLVVVRLNGGLGTTMGLEKAKSLLTVKNSYSFNDIIALQLRTLGQSTGVAIPLIHMTSFSTDSDVQVMMKTYPDLSPSELPATFQQHRHPKVYADSMSPAKEAIEDFNWNPPGHGDIYASLIATGLAEKLLSMGKRYLFVANADNLGATVEPAILGYMAQTGAPFLMETAERTKADAKGGHLARRRSTGHLLLRESSQAPTTSTGEIIPQFQDVSLYRHFNTNNIWLDLEAVVRVAKSHEGTVPLPLISNRKTVNPRDKSSRKVIQVETAMGAAIEVFEGARALQVPRSRFAPVKSNNDLLVVRSDVYVLNPDYTMTVAPEREAPGLPLVSLDPAHYGLIKDFERRIRVVPSLIHAESLSVQGDVTFSHPVAIVGQVVIKTGEQRPKEIKADVSRIESGECLI